MAPKKSKFIVLETTNGRMALNLERVEQVSFVHSVLGLPFEDLRLRLSMVGSHVDVMGDEEISRVLTALGIRAEELVREEEMV